MKYKLLLIASILILRNISTFAQVDVNHYTVDHNPTPSLVTPYSCSEDLIIKIGEDSLLDMFRLDTTINHVSMQGRICKRFSYNGGDTWTQYETVFDSPFDDRCIGGGMVNGKVMIFFREYDSLNNKGNPYTMYSDDKGVSFTTPVALSVHFIDSSGTPYGPIIKADSGKYYQALYGGGLGSYWTQIIQCLDTVNMLWGNPITIYDTTNDCQFSEPGLVYFSKDSMIAHIRHDGGSYTYHQYVSNDNGNTWIHSGLTNIGTVAAGTFRPVSPWFAYDPIRKEIIGFPTIRNNNPVQNKYNDNILCYINTGTEVFANPTGWTIRDSVKRPMPNTSSIYGYITSTWLNDSTLFCTMTDDSSTVPHTLYGQYAALYQFKITYHTQMPNSISNVNTQKENIIIYPNPSSGEITIDNARGDLSAADVLGRIVLRKKVDGKTIIILPAGVYIISIQDNKSVHQNKVIVLK